METMYKKMFPFEGELKVGDLCMYGNKVYKVMDVEPYRLQGIFDEAPFLAAFQYYVKPIPLDSPNMWEINGFDLTGRRWSKVFRNGTVVYVNKLRFRNAGRRANNQFSTYLVEINFPPPFDETISINEVVYFNQLDRLFDIYSLNEMEKLFYDIDDSQKRLDTD